MPHIRIATAADAEQMLAIYAPYIDDTAVTFEIAVPAPAEFAARVVDSGKTHPWLVAVDGDLVLGYAYASVFRTREAYQWAADCSIYVHADHRRSGVATALYASLFACLRLQGYSRVHAGITLPNMASVALHTRLGFTPIGTYEDIGYKLGAWHSVWWCVLALQAATDAPPAPALVADVASSPAWAKAIADGERLLR